MTAIQISSVRAIEILDSRGRPTVAVQVTSSDGVTGYCSVPSGASTGSGEAVERRDGDPKRFGGLGVLRAVEAVNGEIAELLISRKWPDLEQVDQALIELDGTHNKLRLGANAILGASVAVARTMAATAGAPLWSWLRPDGVQPRLPVPHFNVVNGGAHAPNQLDFQEFMIAPLGAPTITEAVRAGTEVYTMLRSLLTDLGHHTGLGDEGGFAPEITEPEEVLRLLTEAIDGAGYRAGCDGVAIALDPAASGFRQVNGSYRVGGQYLSAADLVDRYVAIVARYPVWSIEDGLGEDDDDGWRLLTDRLGEQVQLVGDDSFVTDPDRIRQAAEAGIANAALIKPNQIGTMSQCLEAMATCRRVGYAQMVSHRSGETSDDLIADLAVGSGCGQLKSGAPARGERVAKYNRLMEIESTGSDLPYGLP
ncbi:MAG: phosphopyruvate hydratase, partial [Pseudonocardiaceae bacterium]